MQVRHPAVTRSIQPNLTQTFSAAAVASHPPNLSWWPLSQPTKFSASHDPYLPNTLSCYLYLLRRLRRWLHLRLQHSSRPWIASGRGLAARCKRMPSSTQHSPATSPARRLFASFTTGRLLKHPDPCSQVHVLAGCVTLRRRMVTSCRYLAHPEVRRL